MLLTGLNSHSPLTLTIPAQNSESRQYFSFSLVAEPAHCLDSGLSHSQEWEVILSDYSSLSELLEWREWLSGAAFDPSC